jgi:hypothetical protein
LQLGLPGAAAGLPAASASGDMLKLLQQQLSVQHQQ